MSALRGLQITIQRSDQGKHVRRGFSGEVELPASARMGETEAGRVQRLAWKVQESVAGRLGQCAGDSRGTAEIERVADHRVAVVGEMHTDLVGAAGGEAALDESDRVLPGAQGTVVSEEGPDVERENGHALWVVFL